jgi:chitin disaccharide deacetylase
LSSELLGFAPNVRVLIINRDDFGMSDTINAALVDSIGRGIASSCRLMTPCPGAAAAIRLLGERPAIPFGVHLTLVHDAVRDRWRPLTTRESAPALLDEAGEPNQLDWHCPPAGGRADLFDPTVALGREYGVAARVWLAPARPRTRRRGLPVVDNEFVNSFRLDIDTKAATYPRLLRAMPAGLRF